MPYLLDIDPIAINQINGCDSETTEVTIAYLTRLQDDPYPHHAKPMANGALYAQMANRYFIAWDFPEGRLAGSADKRVLPVRVLGIGKHIKTYERWPFIFR